MKNVFIFIIILLGQIDLIAQFDTILVYDIHSKTEEIIPIGPFDTTAISDFVTGNKGSWEDILQLDLDLPISLPPYTSFSDLVIAKDQFDLLKYPIRTNVAIVWYDSIYEQYATCSGTLIANNIVLTAGHCIGGINSLGEFKWKREGMHVSPSHSSGLPQPSIGKIKVDKYVVFKKFYESYTVRYDFGLLLLEEPIGDLIGWLGYGFNYDSIFYTQPIFYSFSYPSLPEYSGFDMYSYYGNFNEIYIENRYVKHGVPGFSGMSGSSFFYTNNKKYISYGLQTHSTSFRLNSREHYYAIKRIDELYNVGISEINHDNDFIKVYPNPMSDFCSIEIIETGIHNDKLTFILYDLYGNECFRISNITENIFHFKRGKLKAGIYFFFVKSKTGIVGKGKIIIK